MGLLSNVEKGALVKLFNRSGYVLDFSTPDFDAFTLDSVGEALCEKYGMSKGRSLNAYINEAGDSETTKLLIDLFEHYEFAFSKEIESNNELFTLTFNTVLHYENSSLDKSCLGQGQISSLFSPHSGKVHSAILSDFRLRSRPRRSHFALC